MGEGVEGACTHCDSHPGIQITTAEHMLSKFIRDSLTKAGRVLLFFME